MKIKTRLTVYFTLIVASLLAVFAIFIYYFTASYHSKEFYSRLNEKADNYAQLMAEVDTENPGMVTLFDKNTAYLPDEHILVFSGNHDLLFDTHEKNTLVKKDFLREIKEKKQMEYIENEKETVARFYLINGKEYLVIVSAQNTDSLYKLENLRIILLTGFIIGIIVTLIAGWIFATRVLKPITSVVHQVEKISASKLNERVNTSNETDEIGQLAVTFNRMLERLQHSFELQKSFVSNSSHELRTPLTSITGQLEVALMNKRNPDEYKEVLHSVLEDIKNVNRLTNGLLELAQAEMDISKLKLKSIRIDEILWQTRADVLKRYPEYKINIQMQGYPEEESRLIIEGNEYLLKSAIMNVMDNACKFSRDKSVDISLEIGENEILISFRDNGIGISTEDINQIVNPFFRGENAKSYPGHGLGLSLTAKIMQLHEGELKIESKIGKYTLIQLSLHAKKQRLN